MTARYRIGVDVGGTFTDIVFLRSDGALLTRKLLSSVGDYAEAIVRGVDGVMRDGALAPESVAEILHGTTVASNAILEGKGARIGLITTRGFRDTIELRHLRIPRLYDIGWRKPPTLVPRWLRLEVDERMDARGQVLRALSQRAAREAVRSLLAEKVEAIAVCLLHSYANPAHERLVGATISRLAPGLPFCLSSDVLPEIKEYERSSTTVINTYVMPVVRRYLGSLQRELKRHRIEAPLWLMQSNGGLIGAAAAAAAPMHIVESGPAGGVIGAQALARKLGIGELITFDMGGTTAKASLIEGGQVSRSPQYEVGGGIMIGTRLLSGGGYLLKVPAIDLAEVGAGGGSILSIDAGGALRVGPESAGAAPGPACYGIGGTLPTVTDASVVLGYINPKAIAGGTVPLDVDKARAAMRTTIARPLGMTLERAAFGAHQVAIASMMRAVRAVSSERGRDPRRCMLFAFGGNGPLFAARMAEALGIVRIIVPPSSGLFSSFGFLYAEVEHHLARTIRGTVATLDPHRIERSWRDLARAALKRLAQEGFAATQVRLQRTAALRYLGQNFELRVAVGDGPLDRPTVRGWTEAFAAEHERSYGHRGDPDLPVELVSIALTAVGIPSEPRMPHRLHAERAELTPPVASRRSYFGARDGWIETPILRRADAAGGIEGPAIIEEYDATCLVPPRARLRVDDDGNMLLDLGAVQR